MANCDYIEITMWNKGRSEKLAKGHSLEEVLSQIDEKQGIGTVERLAEKMMQGTRKAMNCDATPHVVLICGLVWWAVFASTVMLFMAGGG